MDSREESNYWRDLYEQQQDADRRQREYEYEQREQRRREYRYEIEQAQYCAETWPEAFSKALPRYRYEAQQEKSFDDSVKDDPEWMHLASGDSFFQQQAEQIEYAETVYNEEMSLITDRVRRIRERADRLIANIEQKARDRVADNVDSKFGEETYIAQNLRDNDPESVVNW